MRSIIFSLKVRDIFLVLRVLRYLHSGHKVHLRLHMKPNNRSRNFLSETEKFNQKSSIQPFCVYLRMHVIYYIVQTVLNTSSFDPIPWIQLNTISSFQIFGPMAMMDKTKMLSLSCGLVLLAIVVGSRGTKLRVTTVLVRKEFMFSFYLWWDLVSFVLIDFLVRTLYNGKWARRSERLLRRPDGRNVKVNDR